MKNILSKYKNELHKCSQCGLCMAVCPLYLETKNDCYNARGIISIINGIIRGDLEFNDTVLKYLKTCTKCNKCKNFCPSSINIPKIFREIQEQYYK